MPQEPESNNANKSKLTTQEQVINFISIIIKNGGLVGGGAGAAWIYFKDSDIPKAIASMLLGALISYGGETIKPIHEGNKKRFKGLGESADRFADRVLDVVGENVTASWRSLGFTEKYLKCQEWDCHEDNVVGMREDDDLPVNNPLLREVFVPLELSADSLARGYEFRDRAESRTEACEQLQIWQLLELVRKDNRLRQIAIRAWGGYGKSTLLKHLAYIYSTQEYCKEPYRRYKVPTLIPFLLILGGCWKEITKENPPNLPELLTDYHIGRLTKIKPLEPVPSNWALNILRRGDALVMFDGFDEVPPAERAKVSSWLSDAMRQYPESVFILTSRPTAYKEDYVARKPTASFWIKDFNQEQRKKFVVQWYLCQERYARGGRNTPDVEAKATEKANKLLEQIDARPELKDLAGNALLLNMMARFHRDNKQGSELPQRKVELYQEICELQLGRRASARGIILVLNSISQRQEVLQFVALEMMCGGSKTFLTDLAISLEHFEKEGFKQISQADLLGYIATALEKIDSDVSALEFLKQSENISELIVKKDGNIYQFAHLSFQEFLAACELVRLKEGGEKLIFKCLGISAWKDVALFYAAMINPTKLIQEALNQKHTDLAYRIYKQSEKRLNLSIAEQKSLEGVKQSVTESRYQQLEEYLKAKEWEKADRETDKLMLSAVGKESGQWLEPDELRNFPCDELLAIDRLWVKHSNGLYGFSVQKQIYEECGGKLDFSYPSDETWDKFCDLVAWKDKGKYLTDYSNFFDKKFINKSGHLPFGGFDGLVGRGVLLLLFSHPDL
ncbi:GUN4 domain-containing protein [Pseudanabaena sp. UWO310]|uniref:GUN4 domain-containing protein n=1 Tax=Pseudanabaena sp. UWO310 TaxID=2480795 RepID=UPI00115A37BE|nr:GUN4 domain-containing protein [Pseudanabaena sp. UWO310]TYQ31393.1 NACHT domain-containing protein [Pseudanabaena sp. UWO310]